MPNPINLSVELQGVEKAVVAIRQIAPELSPAEITERLNAAIGLVEYRTRVGLAEPGEWRPLAGIRVTEVEDDAS